MIIQYTDGGAEPGRVTHVVSVHAPDYANLLRAASLKFIEVTTLPPFDVLGEGYVREGVLMRRPMLEAAVSRSVIVADGDDEAVISNLPVPCQVLVDEELVEVTDGALHLSASMPAIYRVEVSRWPYQPWSVEISAVHA